MKALIPFLAAIPLAACTGGSGTSASFSSAAPVSRVSYDCERGQSITVDYQGQNAKILGGQGRGEIDLVRRASDSGFRYENATESIVGVGNEIQYTMGRLPADKCVAA